jgi:hypothetical protein
MPSVVVGRPRVRPTSSSGRRTAGRRVYLNKGGIEYSERINSIIIQAATKHIPRGKVKNYKPYWNTKLDRLVKEKNRVFHEMETETDPEEKKIIELR